MNKDLYDNIYLIPKEVINQINSSVYRFPNSNGIKRAKNIIKRGKITYQNLKRLKNFFENNSKGEEYELAGGGLMKNFIDKTLNSERDRVKRTEKIKNNIKTGNINSIVSSSVSSLHEEKEKIVNEGLLLNVVAIIIDKDKRILLLKRSNYKDQWQPNKWSLPGGGIEKNEKPEDALKREVKEETKIIVDKFNEKFVVQRSSNNVEHIFTVKFDGEPEDINIDFENNGFGWFTFSEIRYLDTVPNLVDYVRMGITNYE